MAYQRRADYADLPLPIALGILKYEEEIAETDEKKKKNARAAVEKMEDTIHRMEVKPAKGPQFIY